MAPTPRNPINIGQLAKASGVNAKLIRYYESIGVLPEAERTEAGYRLYSWQDVERLRFVRRARSLGFGMDEIKHLLSLWNDTGRASADVKRLALGHVQTLEAKIAEMQSMVDVLRELAGHCHGDERPECPILGDLARDTSAEAEAAGRKKTTA